METSLSCPDQEPTEASSRLLEDGNSAFEKGDFGKAEASWLRVRECFHTTPAWPKAVFNLGMLEYRRSRFQQAIAYFDEVLQSHPDDKEPGSNLMQTNRNYSNRSAMAISQCYEAMGQLGAALRYAWMAKTKYRYYSWCGTCLSSANLAMNKRIAYLALRVTRPHIWAGLLILGFLAIKWKRRTSAHLSVG